MTLRRIAKKALHQQEEKRKRDRHRYSRRDRKGSSLKEKKIPWGERDKRHEGLQTKLKNQGRRTGSKEKEKDTAKERDLPKKGTGDHITKRTSGQTH